MCREVAPAQLLELLSLAGPVRSLTLPGQADADADSAESCHKGFAFLTFHELGNDSQAAAGQAYVTSLLHGLNVAGRKLAVRPASIGNPGTWGGEVNVGQISPSVDAFMLRDIFGSCGVVADVRVLPLRSSSSTQSAFVAYGSRREAARAIRVLHALPLFGQPIDVRWSRHALQAAESARAVRKQLLRGASDAPSAARQRAVSYSSDSESANSSVASASSASQGGMLDDGFEELGSDAAAGQEHRDEHAGGHIAHSASSTIGQQAREGTVPAESDGPPPAVAQCLARCARDRVRLQLAWDAASDHTARCQGSMPALPPSELRIVLAPHGPTPVDVPYSFSHGTPTAYFVALGVCSATRATDALLAAARQSSQYSQTSQDQGVRRRSPPPFPPTQSRWRPAALPPFSPVQQRPPRRPQDAPQDPRWNPHSQVSDMDRRWGGPGGSREQPPLQAQSNSRWDSRGQDPRWGGARR